MDLLEAIKQRKSTRAFLQKEVPKELLEQIIFFATRAPSAINLQPWEFVIVSGQERERLSRILVKRMKERNISCGPDAKAPLPDRFLERQRGLMRSMLPHLPEGVDFQDFINEGSCNFYGAPSGMIVLIDRIFSSSRLMDVGISISYLLLSAHALGLGTCPIGLITAFDDDIREFLNIPDEKKVVLAIAVGYPDPSAQINRVRSNRVSPEQVTRWWS